MYRFFWGTLYIKLCPPAPIWGSGLYLANPTVVALYIENARPLTRGIRKEENRPYEKNQGFVL